MSSSNNVNSASGNSASGLDRSVPTFNGANWLEWSNKTKSYLQATGLWFVVSGREVPKHPTLGAMPVLEVGPARETSEAAGERLAAHTAALEDWREKSDANLEWETRDMKVLGFFKLKIVPSIHHLFENRTSSQVWNLLRERYQAVGVGALYADFVAATNFRLSGSGNPDPEIARLSHLFQKLHVNNLELPEMIKAMMLLRAIPQKWESIAQIAVQSNDPDRLTFEAIRQALITEFDRKAPATQLAKAARSSIKHKGPTPPFKPQQPQQQAGGSPPSNAQPSGGWQQQKKKGAKKGKKAVWKGKKKATGQSHIAFAALPVREDTPMPQPMPGVPEWTVTHWPALPGSRPQIFDRNTSSNPVAKVTILQIGAQGQGQLRDVPVGLPTALLQDKNVPHPYPSFAKALAHAQN